MTLCHLFFLSLYSPGLWSRRSFKMWTSSASKTLQHKFSCYCFCIKFWRHFQDDKQWRRSFWLHYSTQSNQRKTTNDGSHKPDGQGQRVDAVRLDAPGHSSRGQRVSIILTVTMIKLVTDRTAFFLVRPNQNQNRNYLTEPEHRTRTEPFTIISPYKK